MNKVSIKRLIPLTGLAGLAALATGCSSSLNNIGGADLRLEGLSLGEVTMEGKTVEGIPSDKITLVLDAAARTVSVSSTEDGLLLTAEPSGATVEITKNGVSIKGLDSKSIKVEWEGQGK